MYCWDSKVTDMGVRIARPGDDAAIAELLSRTVMPGAISISCQYENSFFTSLEIEGGNPRVVVGEQSGRVVGVGSITTRNVYLRGEPTEIGYLATLRLAPEARGSTLLARGYRILGEIHDQELRLPFSLTSIMKDNRQAIRVLTSGKAGLPRYNYVAGYKSAVIPVLRAYDLPRDIGIVRGDEAGPDALFHCIELYGGQKDFSPVYRREEWLAGTGMLKGLRPEDFLVAFRGAEPVGCVALWDHSPFRKLVVRGYSGAMKIAGMVDRSVGKITGAPLLPVPGRPFAPLYLSCVAVKDDDPVLFRAILAAALTRMRERKQRLLVAGFFEHERLGTVVDSFFHVPMYSNIYTVSWNGSAEVLTETARERYIDVGSL